MTQLTFGAYRFETSNTDKVPTPPRAMAVFQG